VTPDLEFGDDDDDDGDTTPSWQTNGSKQVKDNEGTIDDAVKGQIITARERVAEREDLLFVQAPLEQDISRTERIAMWGTTVRQYLRFLEPLLRAGELEGGREVYETEEIGQITLYPPDRDQRAFSQAAQMVDEYDDAKLRKMLNLPRESTVPRPQHVSVRGLKQVIEMPRAVSEQWQVCIDASGPPPQHRYITLETAESIPKQIYEDAVRLADEFRQQAGIGVELGHREQDDQDEQPF